MRNLEVLHAALDRIESPARRDEALNFLVGALSRVVDQETWAELVEEYVK